jgi:predicted PolB exonuclease-like 3'-5' exonuclease
MATSDVRYLLFDIESIADGNLIAKTRYPGETLPTDVAVRRFRQDLMLESGRDFIPYTYHLPIAVVVAKIDAELKLREIVSLDQPQHRPAVITKHFWTGWEKYGHPTFVTFNGRSFDIPLMELSAFRFGVPVPAWFHSGERSYQQFRNRYNVQAHIDLHEMLTNFGSTWFRGGLNLAASLLGKPGKMDVQGDMVQDLYQAGKVSEINEYCRCDVLDTYFVFLRWNLLCGKISLEQEHDLVAHVKMMLEGEAHLHPAYKTYLERWGDWVNPWQKETAPNSTAS